MSQLWVPWERVEALLNAGNKLADRLNAAEAEAAEWDQARYKIVPQTTENAEVERLRERNDWLEREVRRLAGLIDGGDHVALAIERQRRETA